MSYIKKEREEYLEKDTRLFKVPSISSTRVFTGPVYCIFRVGRKYKALTGLKGFANHVNRKKETLNADAERTVENETLYGNDNIYQDGKEYLKDCNVRSNSTVGRELLLTATPEFFHNISKQEMELWKYTNLKWLQDNFGENLRYVKLHMDE